LIAKPKVTNLFSEEIPVQSISSNVLKDVPVPLELFGEPLFILVNLLFVNPLSTLVFCKILEESLNISEKKDKIFMLLPSIEELLQLPMTSGNLLSFFLNPSLCILNYLLLSPLNLKFLCLCK